MIIVAGGLLMASCSPNGEAKSPKESPQASVTGQVATKSTPETKSAPETAPVTPAANIETPTSNSPEKTMPEHELSAYFSAAELDMYSNCHSEKSAYDDFLAGKTIPKELVKKYRLYKFNISPKLGLRNKQGDPQVTVKGGTSFQHSGKTILIYHVGIGIGSDVDYPDEGVDTRALVLDANGEKFANYFIGGYFVMEGIGESTVCRKVTFKGDEMVLTLDEENSPGLPSHLKLLEVETRDLK